MSVLKKINLLLVLLITLQVFSNSSPQKNTSFFISGNYEEAGVKINYSAVINALFTDDFNGQKHLSMQLSSFLIEDAKYDNRIYRDNDIFGISFPIDTAVEITAEIQFLFGVKLINKTVVLHPNKKTVLNLNTNKTNFNDTQLNVKKTLTIKALHSHEIFIDDIKKEIKGNKERKDSEVIEQEHTRLMILGNNYLNENNYELAVSTYQHAKKFTTDISYAESQILTTSKYAKTYDLIIDTENKLHTTVNKDYYTTKQPSIFNAKTTNNNIVKVNKSSQNKYPKIKVHSSESRSNEPVYAVNDDDIDAEYEYEYEITTPLKMTTIFDEDNEFEYEYDGAQQPSTGNSSNSYSQNEYEAEYETEDGKAINYQKNTPIVSNLKNKEVNSSTIKVISKPQKTGIKKVVPNQSKPIIIADVKKPSNQKFEVIKTKKGYIKYRKDEQAVEDREGNILIPYGKHQIIRFRAGFARVKLKDDTEIKNIACINKNEEYTWSARIYENPWKETVMDKDGRFVDKVIKKVEIYIVDNVNNIPNSELSPELLKRYEDPNPFKGTKQISAFNLWNRSNAQKPNIIQKRAEIERLKQISKDAAFEGAEQCRSEVSKRFEEVYNYYEKMGYEIILKN